MVVVDVNFILLLTSAQASLAHRKRYIMYHCLPQEGEEYGVCISLIYYYYYYALPLVF